MDVIERNESLPCGALRQHVTIDSQFSNPIKLRNNKNQQTSMRLAPSFAAMTTLFLSRACGEDTDPDRVVVPGHVVPTRVTPDALKHPAGAGANEHTSEHTPAFGLRRAQVAEIVGGTVADHNDYPYFISLSMGCGATLVHEDIGVSAIHCYDSSFTATVGPDQVLTGVLQKVVHSQYSSSTQRNDFAIFKLDGSFPSNPLPSIISNSGTPSARSRNGNCRSLNRETETFC
jgi:Trypsin